MEWQVCCSDSSQIWGADWWWWHLLRLLAYSSVLGHTFFLHQQTQKELRDLAAVLEQRVAERSAAAAHQTEVLRSILDGMSEGVFVADADGSLILINPAAERMIGRPSEPTLAATRGTSEFYHPDTVTPLDVQDLPSTRAIRGEEVDDAEMYLRPRHKGKGFWISATLARSATRRGVFAGAWSSSATSPRVSERRRSGACWSWSRRPGPRRRRPSASSRRPGGEEQYHSLADLIPGVVWTARADGSIDYANQFWFNYTALTMAQTKVRAGPPGPPR